MKPTRNWLAGIIATTGLLCSTQALADLALFDFGLKIDDNGAVDATDFLFCEFTYCDNGASLVDLNFDPAVAPASVDLSGFDFLTGLGDITVTVTAAGSHQVALYVDHEIDEFDNTYFNENALVNGAPGAGQSWEIDEPDFNDMIVDDFIDGVLTNAIGALFPQDDIAMAMAWDFDLLMDQIATVTFSLTDTEPQSGFFLSHVDLDSMAANLPGPSAVYFTSMLTIATVQVPEPAVIGLMIAALAGGGLFGRRRRSNEY